MRARITTALEAVGAAVFIAGVALIYIPAAFLVAGVFFVAAGYLIDRTDGDEPTKTR